MSVHGNSHYVEFVAAGEVTIHPHPLDWLLVDVSVVSSNSKQTTVLAQAKTKHLLVDDLRFKHSLVDRFLLFKSDMLCHAHS